MKFKLASALDSLNTDQLRALASCLHEGRKPTLKKDLVELIERIMLSPAFIKERWEKLDDTEKLAVAETIHSEDNSFDSVRFKAKHGKIPSFGDRWGNWRNSVPPLRFFFPYGSCIAEDTAQLLRKFVSKPAPVALAALDSLPENLEVQEEEYEWQEDDEGITVMTRGGVYRMPRQQPNVKFTTHQVPLTRRDTEACAQQDLQSILRVIDRGKIAVGEATKQPSRNSVVEITAHLAGGDYYEIGDEAGPIKAFAWPMLLQHAKLADVHGKKLALTKAGLDALTASSHETLKRIWDHWLKSSFDEFQRIDSIKGQGGKGARSMTAVPPRRAAVVETLRRCPPHKWISLDELSRYMQAIGIDFDVSWDPWRLYITDSNYGSLGYDGSHSWNILQGRYIFCLLFEYASTLGLVDIAFTAPAGSRTDYSAMWGTDDLAFLSRYDGLQYFRINNFGAYCLGLTDSYESSSEGPAGSVRVLPSLQITLLEENFSPDAALILDSYADREAANVWRLDRPKAIAAVERGHKIEELKSFLQARDDQPLPETVEAFISNTEKQARALRNTGMAILVECADDKIAEKIASHKGTKNLCKRAGQTGLVVATRDEEAFRKAVNVLGYGMPRV